MRAREVLDVPDRAGRREKTAAAGSPDDHWSAAGYGDTDPVAGNDSAEGMQKNRRVELVVRPERRGNARPEEPHRSSAAGRGSDRMHSASPRSTSAPTPFCFSSPSAARTESWCRSSIAPQITRLGQGVDRSRELSPEAVERTLACLASMRTRSQRAASPRSTWSAPARCATRSRARSSIAPQQILGRRTARHLWATKKRRSLSRGASWDSGSRAGHRVRHRRRKHRGHLPESRGPSAASGGATQERRRGQRSSLRAPHSKRPAEPRRDVGRDHLRRRSAPHDPTPAQRAAPLWAWRGR